LLLLLLLLLAVNFNTSQKQKNAGHRRRFFHLRRIDHLACSSPAL